MDEREAPCLVEKAAPKPNTYLTRSHGRLSAVYSWYTHTQPCYLTMVKQSKKCGIFPHLYILMYSGVTIL